eukprot:scaffold109700_cov60-Phaeocystis_antarctica.AAC.3
MASRQGGHATCCRRRTGPSSPLPLGSTPLLGSARGPALTSPAHNRAAAGSLETLAAWRAMAVHGYNLPSPTHAELPTESAPGCRWANASSGHHASSSRLHWPSTARASPARPERPPIRCCASVWTRAVPRV